MYSRYPFAMFDNPSLRRPRIRIWNHWINRQMHAMIPYTAENDADENPVDNTDEQFQATCVMLEGKELVW